MKILVTGGAGFIGSNLVYFLEKKGYEVVIIDNLSTGKKCNIDKIKETTKFYLQDIRNNELVKVFEIERPDIVIHLAAQASVIASIEDPILDADINIKGILNILNFSVKYGVKKFLFSSTGGAIYGDALEIPTSEKYVPEVISPYALTKYASENYINIYNKLYNLKYTILRFANVYGPRQVPKGECGVIPVYFKKCLNNEDAVLYAYKDMEKGSARDYVYVEDVCRAIGLCINNADGEMLNIGTSVETYTKDVFSMVKELCESTNGLNIKCARIGEV